MPEHKSECEWVKRTLAKRWKQVLAFWLGSFLLVWLGVRGIGYAHGHEQYWLPFQGFPGYLVLAACIGGLLYGGPNFMSVYDDSEEPADGDSGQDPGKQLSAVAAYGFVILGVGIVAALALL